MRSEGGSGGGFDGGANSVYTRTCLYQEAHFRIVTSFVRNSSRVSPDCRMRGTTKLPHGDVQSIPRMFLPE